MTQSSLLSAACCALALTASPLLARAQGLDHSDEGTSGSGHAEEPERLPWRDSFFIWSHSASGETLGIGEDVQSRNPFYEMTFRLAPRLYFADTARRNTSVRGDLRLIRELTDSDITTDRGEWTFTDLDLWVTHQERLFEGNGARTELVVRAPWVSLPTSKASRANGSILGLGAGLGLDQLVPLRGAGASAFTAALLRPRVSYLYRFVDAVVPANDEIGRVRLNPDGVAVPSDQLSGTAFPKHELNVSFRAETGLLQRLTLITELGMRYAVRYALQGNVDVCGVVTTGCVAIESDEDAPRWGVSTLFDLGLSYSLTDYLSMDAAYTNLSGQLGADGQRRSVFHSPDARFGISATLSLDVVYQALANGRGAASAGAAPPAF